MAILSFALPFGLYAGLNHLVEKISGKVHPEAVQQIKDFHLEVFQVYSLSALIGIGILFWLTFIFSHRIAGPIYRIQSALGRWKRGNVESHLNLRRDDHFKELAVAYNEAAHEFTELRNRVRIACDQLEDLSQDLELKHRTQVHELIGALKWNPEQKS